MFVKVEHVDSNGPDLEHLAGIFQMFDNLGIFPQACVYTLSPPIHQLTGWV